MDRQRISDMVKNGCSVAKIANELGTTKSNVYTHLSRMGLSVKKNKLRNAVAMADKFGTNAACEHYGIKKNGIYTARYLIKKGLL